MKIKKRPKPSPDNTPIRPHITNRKNLRPHIAQEFREAGSIEDAEAITRHLMPRFRGRVQGLKDTHYVYPGFRSSERRSFVPPSN